jgi:type IV pilus assembly protein PilB
VLRSVGIPFEIWQDKKLGFHNPVGCEECGGSGYLGRVGVYELMLMEDEVETLTLSRSSADEVGRAAVKRAWSACAPTAC